MSSQNDLRMSLGEGSKSESPREMSRRRSSSLFQRRKTKDERNPSDSPVFSPRKKESKEERLNRRERELDQREEEIKKKEENIIEREKQIEDKETKGEKKKEKETNDIENEKEKGKDKDRKKGTVSKKKKKKRQLVGQGSSSNFSISTPSSSSSASAIATYRPPAEKINDDEEEELEVDNAEVPPPSRKHRGGTVSSASLTSYSASFSEGTKYVPALPPDSSYVATESPPASNVAQKKNFFETASSASSSSSPSTFSQEHQAKSLELQFKEMCLKEKEKELDEKQAHLIEKEMHIQMMINQLEEKQTQQRDKQVKEREKEQEGGKPFKTPEALSQYDEKSVLLLQRAVRSWIMRKRWTNLCRDFAASKESLELRLRNEAVKEIVDSERVYVTRLQFCLSNFLQPLEDAIAMRKPILSSDQINSVFAQIDVIEALNTALLNELEARMKLWPSVTTIGDIFRRMAPILRLYSNYIRSYNKAQQVLEDYKQNVSGFSDWLTDAESNEGTQGQNLPSFLILPVQRLPRYQLLIDGILKHTVETHQDYTNLKNARDNVVQVIHSIEQESRNREHRDRILYLQQLLNLPSLFTGNEERRLVFEAPITVQAMMGTTKFYGDTGKIGNFVYRTAGNFDYQPVGSETVLYHLLSSNSKKTYALMSTCGRIVLSICISNTDKSKEVIDVRVSGPVVIPFQAPSLASFFLSVKGETTVKEFASDALKQYSEESKELSSLVKGLDLVEVEREKPVLNLEPIINHVSSKSPMEVTAFIFSDHIVLGKGKDYKNIKIAAVFPFLYCMAKETDSKTAASISMVCHTGRFIKTTMNFKDQKSCSTFISSVTKYFDEGGLSPYVGTPLVECDTSSKKKQSGSVLRKKGK